ncbi:MAG: CoA transferase, partial [Caulobacteraceae bacterium]
FGAFGRDFAVQGGGRVMIVAITARQWRNLVDCLGLAEAMAALETETGADFTAREGDRYLWRERLFPLFEAALAARTAADLAPAFAAAGVCWAPYRTLSEAAAEPWLARDNPIFADIVQPSGETYPAPGAIATFAGEPRQPPTAAPRLGEHTDAVLADVLCLDGAEIARLHDARLVAGPDEAADSR